MRFGMLGALLAVLAGWTVSRAQTPVGTVITGRSRAVCVDKSGTAYAGESEKGETRVIGGAYLVAEIAADHAPAAPGDTLVWTLRVHNAGNTPARGVTVRDSLEGTLVLLSAGEGRVLEEGVIVWDTPVDLEAGESIELDVQVQVEEATALGGTLFSALTARGENVEPAQAEDELPIAREPNLELSLRPESGTVRPGEGFRYQVGYRNRGSARARQPRLAVNLARELDFVSAEPPPAQQNERTFLWAIDQVERGEQGAIELEVRVRDAVEPGTSIGQRAYLAAMANQRSGVQVESPPSVLSVIGPYVTPVFSKELERGEEPLGGGEALVYRLVVDNSQGSRVERVVLQDTLDPLLIVDGVEGSGIFRVTGQSVEAAWEPLAAGSRDTVRIRARVRADVLLPDEVVNRAWLVTPFDTLVGGPLVTALQGVIRDGVLTQTGKIMAGERVVLGLADLDQDYDPAVRDSVPVEVVNLRSEEHERLWLRETAAAGGVFAGELPTFFSPGTPTGDDGLMIVMPGDTLQGAYVDTVTTGGVTQVQTARTAVLGTRMEMRAEPPSILANGRDRSLLTVRVTNTEGDPLPAGLEVIFVADQGTFPNGEGRIVVPVQGADGEAQVLYTSPVLAGEAEAQVLAIFGGRESEPIRLQVFPGAGAIRVYDQVRDAEVTAGDPDLGVEVRLEGETVEGEKIEMLVTVDRNGLYVIPDIPPGRYQLLASVTEVSTGRVISDGKLQDIVVEADGSMTPPGNAVSGTLKGKRDKSGERYAGGLVELVGEDGEGSAATTVGEDGTYDFQNLPPGRYELRATLPDGTTATAEVSARSVAAGSVIVNADILIDPFGLVFDADTGAPVPGATVTLRYLSGEVLPIPLLDGIGAAPNLDNINPFVSTEAGRYAFLFGGDQVGSRGHPVEYFMTVEPPAGSAYQARRLRLQVEPVSDDPLDEAIIAMGARSDDGLMMALPNDVILTPDPVFIANIETIAFNIPLFSQAPVLLLEMRVQPDSVGLGDEAVFALIAANVGNLASPPASVVDTLGSDWQLRQAEGGTLSGSVARWDLGELRPGQRDTLRLRAELVNVPAGAARLVERAWLTAGDLLPVQATGEVALRRPAWVLEKNASASSLGPGQKVRYELRFRNTGTGTARGATLIDSLPDGLEWVEGDGGRAEGQVITWELSPLQPGQIDSVQFVARLRPGSEPGQTLTNVAVLRGDRGDGVRVEQARATHQLHTRPLGVALFKQVDRERITPGETARYTLTWQSQRDTLAGWTVRDTLPAELRYVTDSSTQPARYDSAAQLLEWDLPEVGPGEERVWSFAVQPRPDLEPGEYLTRNVAAASTPDMRVVSETAELGVVVNYFEIDMAVDPPVVESGDIVVYRVGLRNLSRDDSLTSVVLTVQPPGGFDYVRGSSRLGEKKVRTVAEGKADAAGKAAQADSLSPLGTDERSLQWSLDGLGAGQRAELSFQVVAGIGAEDSDGRARAGAVATSLSGLATQTSNVVRTQVRVRPSPIFSLGQLIIGRAWVDLNENGVKDKGEPPVPGVVLTMENSTRIVADAHGRFSIPEIERGDHVLRLMPQHLPPGLEPLAAGTRAAGDAWTRFVAPGRAGLIKVNFPLRRVRRGAIKARLYARPRGWLERSLRERPLPDLQPLYFGIGEARVRPEDEEMLAALAAHLRRVPDLRLAVEGHADAQPIATERFPDNAHLSRVRAQRVAARLVRAGVDPQRLEVRDWGAEQPVASNVSAAGRLLNRRVEITPLAPVPSLYDLTLRGEGPGAGLRVRQPVAQRVGGTDTLAWAGGTLQMTGVRVRVEELAVPQGVDDPSREFARAGSNGRDFDLWYREEGLDEALMVLDTVRAGARATLGVHLVAAADGEARVRLPEGVEAAGAVRWSVAAGDTLEPRIEVAIPADFAGPQLSVEAVLTEGASGRIMAVDTLRAAVDTRPRWRIVARHAEEGGQTRRTVALTYLGEEILPRVHLTERLPEGLRLAPDAEGRLPLRGGGGLLWTWKGVEPGAELSVAYRLEGPGDAAAIASIVSCGLDDGQWIEAAGAIPEGEVRR